MVIIFLFNGTNERYFFVCISKIKLKKIKDKSVANEAPIKPFELSKEKIVFVGTNIEFKTKFNMAAIIVFIRMILDFPSIDIRLVETTKTEEKNVPTNKNLSASCAGRYC